MIHIFTSMHTVYYWLTDYELGQLLELIFSIFLIIRISIFSKNHKKSFSQ